MVDVVSKEQLTTARNFKQLYSRYQRNRDLINVGLMFPALTACWTKPSVCTPPWRLS